MVSERHVLRVGSPFHNQTGECVFAEFPPWQHPELSVGLLAPLKQKYASCTNVKRNQREKWHRKYPFLQLDF